MVLAAERDQESRIDHVAQSGDEYLDQDNFSHIGLYSAWFLTTES